MKTSWETSEGNILYSIYISAFEVSVGDQYMPGGQYDGSSCTHEAFLQGGLHHLILNHFGSEVLAEVIKAVKAAQTHPPFQAKRNKLASLRAYLDRIPLDPPLAGLDQHPETVKGWFCYGNAGGYKTVVQSDTVTLTVEQAAGFVARNDGQGSPHVREFRFDGWAEEVVELRDHFYLVVSQDYAVVDPNGRILEDPREHQGILGGDLRIQHVYRHKDIICFSYQWMRRQYPNGLLRYEVGKGFTGRWEENN
jgi:hypothetical protein